MSLSVLHYSGLSLISLLDSLSGSDFTINLSSFPETETVCLSVCLLFSHMEHNPEVDWCMGKISMMRCPMSCRPKATEEMDQLNHISADMTRKQPKTHLHRQVHVEEVPESESTRMEAEPSPGFAQPDPDELDEGDRLLIWLIGAWSEEIRATWTISQKLSKAAGGTSSTCFEDIVPKPYQEFQDIFTKDPLTNYPIGSNGTMPLN